MSRSVEEAYPFVNNDEPVKPGVIDLTPRTHAEVQQGLEDLSCASLRCNHAFLSHLQSGIER